MSQRGWQLVSFSLAHKHNRNFNTHFTHLADPILNSTLLITALNPIKKFIFYHNSLLQTPSCSIEHFWKTASLLVFQTVSAFLP